MTTIDTKALVRRLKDHQPLDLIDVRPREEFIRSHIPGAHSAPLNRFAPAKILHERKAARKQPVFVVGDRVRAGLAAGMLRGAGCNLAVVLDGGMDAWEGQGLPAINRRWRMFGGWR